MSESSPNWYFAQNVLTFVPFVIRCWPRLAFESSSPDVVSEIRKFDTHVKFWREYGTQFGAPTNLNN